MILKYNQQNTTYTNCMISWLKNYILLYANTNKLDNETEIDYLKENMFFVTLNFSTSYIYESYKNGFSIGEIERNEFKHFYNLVCREIHGRNYHKISSSEKPFSISCLDANGTRYWREMGEINNIHIHSIWVLKQGTRDVLLSTREKILSKSFMRFDQIHIESFKEDFDYHRSLSRLISYTLKFDRFNQRDAAIADTLLIYPLTRRGPKHCIQ